MRTKLLQARTKKHWTQKQAAAFAAVDYATYRRWESGETTPRASSIRGLCDAFEMSASALGFDDEQIDISPISPDIITGDSLTMRLLAVAFISLPYQRAQRQVATILEEYDMSGDPIHRRTALTYLASLPFVASLRPMMPKRRIEDVITQSNAGIAACWALSKSGDDSDLALAFKGAGDYARHLKPIVEMTTSTTDRKAIAELVAQCEMLQTVLGWHRINPLVATQHGKEAVKYSVLTDDILLQLNALKLLTWAYYYAQDRKEALLCMQRAEQIARQHRIPPHAQSGVDGTLAIAEAFNGISATKTLLHAEQGALSHVDMPDYQMDPLAAHLTKSGLTLYLQRDYSQAQDILGQVVDPGTLQLKHPLPERFRVEALNIMILSELKSKQKDKEHIKRAWQVAMRGTLQMQSKQRLQEATATYSIMEALWPDDAQIQEFRALVTPGIN